ncbi:MAG: ABC transporter permease [Roseofilum sp. SBFL]|uniref:ABC transporter permease n=1 Tax=unclassified Roseofilum TaxID=2620099 RepID=UPI001B12A8A8|nr:MULTISPECIES: ABC transporter permease [unclassified Roseofilum]MBP0037220.1 ABC transporter permease [Roseofilum sp. SID1]MBP0040937.1 ABC transporter permease [Roseofilum sp. SBFL]
MLLSGANNEAFWRFLAGRLIVAILTLLAVSFMIYALIELMPGDYAERELFRKYSGTGVTITQAEIDQVRANLGLDRPFLVRYGEWLWNVVTRFDFGPAFRVETSVNTLLQGKFLYTFVLVVGAMLFSYIVAIPVGIWVATRKSGIADGLVTLLSYLGLALPNFAIALVLLMLNAFVFNLDVTGLVSQAYRDEPWSFAKFLDFLGHAYIPLLVLGWSTTAFQLQTMRGLMKDELGKLYVTAARAKGLSGWPMLIKYPARHAVMPIVSTIGFDFARSFNELPIVASILVLGELGQELLLAFLDADQNTAAGILVCVTSIIIAANSLSDLLVVAIDPRVRLKGR